MPLTRQRLRLATEVPLPEEGGLPLEGDGPSVDLFPRGYHHLSGSPAEEGGPSTEEGGPLRRSLRLALKKKRTEEPPPEAGGSPAEEGGPPPEEGSPLRRSLKRRRTEEPPPEEGGSPAEEGGSPAEEGGSPAEEGSPLRRSPRLALKTRRTEEQKPRRKTIRWKSKRTEEPPPDTGGSPAEEGGPPPEETIQWKSKRPWAAPSKPYVQRPRPPPLGPVPPDLVKLRDCLYHKYGAILRTDDELDPDPDREMWDRYYKELRESDGFDFTPFPVAQRSIRVTVYNMDYIAKTPHGREELKGYITKALKKYNRTNKTNWEYDEIDYLNGGVCGTLNYYITFTAKTATRKQTFQVKVVITPGGYKITYPICREKKNTTVASESTSKG